MKSNKAIRRLLIVACVAAVSVFASVGTASAGSLMINYACGSVPANKTCTTSNFISSGKTVYARFTLTNGPGVKHCAYVFSSSGAKCSTNQYTYSKCVSVSGSGIYWFARGLNDSNSAHNYSLQLYQKTSNNDPCVNQ